MVLRERSDAGERRFEHDRADRDLRRRLHRDRGAERLAVEHDPIRRNAFGAQKIQARAGILEQSGFTWRARVVGIAAVFEQQDAVPFAPQALRPVGPMGNVAAITMEVCDDRPALARR
jgi:hypothetical protein